MSDGLSLVGSVLDSGGLSAFRGIDRVLLTGDEIRVYDFVVRHLRRYKELPAVQTVEEELGVRLPEAPETYEYYYQRVRDRSVYEQLRGGFNELKTCLREFDITKAKDVVDAMRLVVKDTGTGKELVAVDEAIERVLEGYEIAHLNPGVSGVPTGWPRYDNTTGGYQPGDLISVVGRPETGKTYIMLRKVYGAWMAGYSVLVVTMEMSIVQLSRRLLGIMSGVDPTLIRKGVLSHYAEQRLAGAISGMAGTRRLSLFSGGMKRSTGDVELLIQEYTPDIVFVDGAYLMSPNGKSFRSRTEKVSEVIDDIKAMTLEYPSPIVLTTQFNRTAGKKGKDGSLENIAYSDAISTHSSIILSVQPGESPYETDRRRLELIKGREGERGSYDIHYSFRPVNLEEVDVTQDEESGAVTSTNLDWMPT